MTTTPCTGCAVQQGTHQIAEPDAQHLQELAAYRFTVENLQARVAELEAQLAESTHPTQQGLDAQDLDAWKCEKCNGTGIHTFDGYGDSPRGQYPITEREECDECNATGWCDLDAALAAQAKQGGASHG